MTSAGSATPSQDGRAPAQAHELPLRLLLAEDEEMQRTVLASMLTRAGYTVTAVDNGRDALTEILTGEYSLLVTDRGMPGLDGLRLCRAIRSSGRACRRNRSRCIGCSVASLIPPSANTTQKTRSH